MFIFDKLSAEFLIVLFFCITYFFSAFEKIKDWNRTLAFYSNHFKTVFFKKYISPILISIILIECFVFLILGISVIEILLNGDLSLGKIGLQLSSLILFLFLIGQRIVKDYAGAMNIAVYFILNSIGIYLLT